MRAGVTDVDDATSGRLTTDATEPTRVGDGPHAPDATCLPEITRALDDALASARAAGRDVLLEHEGLPLAAALGLAVPAHVVVHAGERDEPWHALPGARLVVKALSASLPHRSDAGAVRIVPRTEVDDVVRTFRGRFDAHGLEGVLVAECVTHDGAPGGELLLGLRATDDFGPVVALGLGGVQAEALARLLPRARALALCAPGSDARERTHALRESAAFALACRPLRGRPARLAPDALDALLRRWLAFAPLAAAAGLREFELNPVALVEGRPWALDALGRLGAPPIAPPAPRPREAIARLYRPRSLALAGVSERMNPGRIMLRNVLDAGFPPDALTVLKPGVDTIDGVRCVPDLDALDAPVDVLAVSLAAASAADLVRDAVARGKARALIVVSGGFDEHASGRVHAERVRAALAASRARADGGAVLNGPNCLGIRSRPGRYDTLFIPRAKLPFAGRPAPLAIVSQSGALAVALCSRLDGLDPHTVVTCGNQLDLTLADHLEALADDADVRVFACYAEGLRPGDGPRLLTLARRLAGEGRALVVCRAGRTAAGTRASASHTAAIAGDFAVFAALLAASGALVAQTLDEFTDLLRLACALDTKRADGLRLGALSNAGFEAVAMADHQGPFTLPNLGQPTCEALSALLATHGLASIVSVANPLDVTPILDDAGFAEAARLLLADDAVDVGAIGCVPLSGALSTLPAGEGHGEDVLAPDALAARLVDVVAACDKACVLVVDAGPLYDPFARTLESRGAVVFRHADRALGVLARYVGWRIGFGA